MKKNLLALGLGLLRYLHIKEIFAFWAYFRTYFTKKSSPCKPRNIARMLFFHKNKNSRIHMDSGAYIYYFFSYKKTYFNTNNTARIYISGVIFFAFPQNMLITTYEITPNTIPSEIL